MKTTLKPSFLEEKLSLLGITLDYLREFCRINKINRDTAFITTESFKNDDFIMAQALFPERKFLQKEIDNLSNMIESFLVIRTSPFFKKAWTKAKNDFPGLGKVALKVIYAENVIMYRTRRNLNKNEQKIFNLLYRSKEAMRLVHETEVISLWEDVLEGRKKAAPRLKVLLRDEKRKDFFVRRFLSDVEMTGLIRDEVIFSAGPNHFHIREANRESEEIAGMVAFYEGKNKKNLVKSSKKAKAS